MMDSLSTQLIAQLYRNPSEINRWQTVVNERHYILVLDMKKERKERNKKLIFWRSVWYDLSIMTLQRRLNAASSETLSNLHRLFSDHRTLQIYPNHQDWFYTLHWSCHQTGRLQRSSCKLKTKWRTDNCYCLVFIGHIFFENTFSNFLTKMMMSYEELNKLRIIVFPWHFVRGFDGIFRKVLMTMRNNFVYL